MNDHYSTHKADMTRDPSTGWSGWLSVLIVFTVLFCLAMATHVQ